MKVDFINFLKRTETIVVFGGVILTCLIGKFWLLPMVLVYSLLKLPNLRRWLKSKFYK